MTEVNYIFAVDAANDNNRMSKLQLSEVFFALNVFLNGGEKMAGQGARLSFACIDYFLIINVC